MADKGARYDMTPNGDNSFHGAPIYMVRTEMQDDSKYSQLTGFFSRIFPNRQGLRSRLAATRAWPMYGAKAERVYVCHDPVWVEVDRNEVS